jgi:hypothetical protein
MPKVITNEVYLAIDLNDKYELPFAVGFSPKEISEILKMKRQTVRYGLSKQNGIFADKKIKIVRVIV